MQSFGAMFDSLGRLLVSGSIINTVLPIGAGSQANNQVAASSVAATLVIARATRRSCTLVNSGAVAVFIGPAGVTALTGASIAPGASRTVTWTGLIQVITSVNPSTVDYWDEF